MKTIKKQTRARGFFVTYALFGIALIAAIAGVMSMMQTKNLQSQNRMELKDQLQSDFTFILQQILNCVTLNPGGFNPDSDTYDSRFPAQTSDYSVGNLKCPAAVSSQADPKSLWIIGIINQQVTLRPPPARNGFSEWKYMNRRSVDSKQGVYLFIELQDVTNTDGIALLNSFRSRSDMSDYFPSPVDTSASPPRLYSINLSSQ